MRRFARAAGGEVADSNDGDAELNGAEKFDIIHPVAQPYNSAINDCKRVEQYADQGEDIIQDVF